MSEISIYDWRVQRAEKVLTALGIPTDVLAVFEENPARDLPYHNNEHALTVLLNAYEGGVRYGLPSRSLVNLVIAALFHDHSHLADQDDAANIKRALDVWARHRVNFANYGVDGDEVATLIAGTEFPYSESSRIEVRILRDADILQTTEVDGDRWMSALSFEQDREITVNDTIEFLSAQVSTEWGIERVQKWVNGSVIAWVW